MEPEQIPASDLPFVVIGAGLGGLATALRLAHRGKRVVLLEKTDNVGGRNKELRIGECRFDSGPTMVMMLDPFRKLFADVGERIEDHLELSLCDPGYRAFFADGARLESTTDSHRMAGQIRSLSGEKDVKAFRELLVELEALYSDAIPNFVRKNYYSPLDFFGPRQLRLVAKHKMLHNLASRIESTFEDPHLRMLLSFQTMYLGLSPYVAPWVYSVLTFMEFGEGIWYPKGGVGEICRAVARLAVQRGVEIRLGVEAQRIEGDSVVLPGGERIKARAILCNADLPYAERQLEGKKPKKRRSSCSAFMIYADYGGSLPDLLHHNVFFGPDFRGNLEDVFSRKRIPENPAFYVAVSARSDPRRAEPGHENLCILMPCPNLDRPWSGADGDKMRSQAFDRLGKEVGFSPDSVKGVRYVTPEDWAATLNLDKGTAFGLSHHFMQSAYFRPSNRSRSNPRLYYVGASTIPGNGLPMVLISAELLEERLEHDGWIAPQPKREPEAS